MANDETELDVVAVSLNDSSVLWIYPVVGERNAEAVISMAAVRQGVDDRFYTSVPRGQFATGEKYYKVSP